MGSTEVTCAAYRCRAIDIPHRESDFFSIGDLHALSVLDCPYEFANLWLAFGRAGVEPGTLASQALDVELIAANCQFPSIRRSEVRSDPNGLFGLSSIEIGLPLASNPPVPMKRAPLSP